MTKISMKLKQAALYSRKDCAGGALTPNISQSLYMIMSFLHKNIHRLPYKQKILLEKILAIWKILAFDGFNLTNLI